MQPLIQSILSQIFKLKWMIENVFAHCFSFSLPTVTYYAGYTFHRDNMDSMLLSIQHQGCRKGGGRGSAFTCRPPKFLTPALQHASPSQIFSPSHIPEHYYMLKPVPPRRRRKQIM